MEKGLLIKPWSLEFEKVDKVDLWWKVKFSKSTKFEWLNVDELLLMAIVVIWAFLPPS